MEINEAKEHTPAVSIGLAVYNGENYLEGAIEVDLGADVS